ncbi:MAG: hypothetical protein JNN07_14235 [Verrucomicrobiales bacterium]|nr:hypothetical protein [Verrucomicrobiales bacterium]
MKIKYPTVPSRSLLSSVLFATFVALDVSAQSYTFIDLSTGSASAVKDGIVVGLTSPVGSSALTRATLWDASGPIDFHPAALLDPVNGTGGRSALEDLSGGIQVGWAATAALSTRAFPMVWRGTAESGAFLPIPFTSFGGQATATDGIQIGGYAIGINDETGTIGSAHAMLWDAATGAATDLGEGNGGAQVFGVAAGQQVGFIVKGNANATLWRGSRGSAVSLHPKSATLSVANGTDGARQVGYAGYDIRVRNEAPKGNKTARFNYAMLWTGTAASALNIHPYPVNAGDVVFTHSIALGLSTTYIAGYANDPAKINTPAYNHAIVWDSVLQSIDLNAFLPAEFIGAQAYGVDEAGNVAGVATKANGERHAVMWQLNPAQ